MRIDLTLALLALGFTLQGCGGGGSSDDGGSGGGGAPDLLAWNGSSNGSVVRDADNDAFAFTTAQALYRNGVTYPGVKTADGKLTWNGAEIGVVVLGAATDGSQIAVTRCTDGSPLNLTFLTDTVTYNCVVTNTAGSPPQEVPPSAVERGFIRWNGSLNDDVVKDANDESFKFYADTGCMYSVARNAETTNYCLKTPSSATGALANLRFSVTRVAAAGGGCIAALTDGAGNRIDIYTDASGNQVAGVTSKKVDATGCGGSNGGSGTDTVDVSGGGAGGGGSTTRGFIAWTGSLNGSTVKDANNENFAFYADTRCLYSYNRDIETSNFCLDGQNAGAFDGLRIRVLSVATAGGCIAALADLDGFQVDIHTSAAGVQTATVGAQRWDVTGCTR